MTVRSDRDASGVVRLTIARPSLRNAFDEEMIAGLTELARGIDGSTRAVVLQSEGDVFCAGADLEWMKRKANASREENLADARALAAMYASLADVPVPLLVRVQGPALGGGAGLVAVADIAIAAEEAWFGFTEVRVGIIPAVVSPYVVRRIGPARATALFTTGERLDARRAYELGLIDRVAPRAELDAAVDATLAAILTSAPNGVRAAKRLVREVTGRRPEDVRERTVETIADVRATEEGREGFDAFLEKRPPRWKH